MSRSVRNTELYDSKVISPVLWALLDKSEQMGADNMNIEMYPLEKIVVDGVIVYLGM